MIRPKFYFAINVELRGAFTKISLAVIPLLLWLNVRNYNHEKAYAAKTQTQRERNSIENVQYSIGRNSTFSSKIERILCIHNENATIECLCKNT